MSNAASYLKSSFGKVELLIRSPGRTNLIGEHVDYTGGHMLPVAVNLGMDMAFRKNERQELRFYSLNFNNGSTIDLRKLGGNKKINGWPAYLAGVLTEWHKLGLPLEGFDLVIEADLPNGAGLSSSAALTCGLAFGLQHLFNTTLTPIELACIARKAERDYIGVKCGWMDQVAVLMSKANHFLYFDTQNMHTAHLPIPDPPPAFIIIDTQVKHSLASSGYNNRVLECTELLNRIQKEMPFIQSLREIPASALGDWEAILPTTLFHRLKHIATENDRVSRAKNLFLAGGQKTWGQIGEIMWAGHDSLRDDYEVSCAELDWLVAYTRTLNYCLGARMVGGGFGGTVLALIPQDLPNNQLDKLRIAYEKRFYHSCEIYNIKTSAGCRVL